MPLILKHMFFWLSGAGTATLEQCPNWEQRKYVAFGATVLVPCLFAFIAAAFAISTLTDDALKIYPIALLWSFIILAIDRALLSSYRPYLLLHRKFGQFALRFVVALLLGITISHPLVLMLFQDTVRAEIERARVVDIETARTEGAQRRAGMEERIAAVEAALDQQRNRLSASYEASFLDSPEGSAEERATARLTAGWQAQDALAQRVEQARTPLLEEAARVDARIRELTPRLTVVQEELDFWQREFEREVDGERSGRPGVGPRARSIEADQISWRRDEVRRLGREMAALTEEHRRLLSEAGGVEAEFVREFEALREGEQAALREDLESQRELRRRIEQQQAETFVSQQDTLRQGILRQIDVRTEELERLQQELDAFTAELRERLGGLQAEPRRDILTQSLALHGLFARGEDGGRFALTVYLVLIGLFMLVDTIPIVVKFFSKPGPYDILVDQDEIRFEKEHNAFMTNYERYVQQSTSSGLSTLTGSRPLERNLVSGVERTRAARALVETLIEQERDFQERIRLEKEKLAHWPDQAAATRELANIEEKSAAFQAYVQRRMEEYFGEDAKRKG
ncbi:DUF4407 domain-containing protein [Desulfonatronum thioautotrophicum]|uniref:DUF4407 domain-containing protein n=1 Tax=Desulfonatronum thioautotrophicum TaxID=617001 RepID=UPI0005EB8F4F|nr:DUF4407 domain-containing protein [Desulfonatronum thioautotrophicum]